MKIKVAVRFIQYLRCAKVNSNKCNYKPRYEKEKIYHANFLSQK